ncbi:MAG TPA: hypothetical protein VHB48_09605, partial [Chitinophagaceae bacterium]|nr:hypothetical protein [Chitinophagaceae bacterium]
MRYCAAKYLLPFARYIKLYGAAVFLFTAFFCTAQPRKNGTLSTIISAVDSTRANMPREKIYLQFNKPVYLAGDTMWFKAYVFDAAYLSPSKQSGILYIDIADENNNIVKQYMLPVAGGVSWGNLPLNPQDFSEGSYTLRAYTNLLKNFGSNNFFYHHFYVAGNTGNAVLVKTQTQVFGNDANDSVVAALKFTGPNMLALANEPLELAVKAGKKRLLRGNVTTGSNGVANLQFVLPAGNTTLTVTAKE